MASNRQCRAHYENGTSRQRQNCQRSQRVHAGVRERVHLLHHQRSLRKVPAGKAQDGQWRGHPLCYDFSWLRELLGSIENLSLTISREPPRKSERQTLCKPVQCHRGQRRRQSPSRECPTPERSKRRHRDGRKRQYGLRLHRPQRQRRRRVLNAGPRKGGQSENCRPNGRPRPEFELHLGHRKRRRLRADSIKVDSDQTV